MNRSNVDKSELRTVELAAAGDQDARRELFERHRGAAFAVALRVTGRREDALDVVQDAFIKAFERIGEFRGGRIVNENDGAADAPETDAGRPAASFKTWLLRIVTNRALDLLRSRRVRLAVSLDQGSNDEGRIEPAAIGTAERGGSETEQSELAQRLRDAMDQLPPDQRATFALFATGDLSYGEIAETLGIPIGTVMSRLYHARRRLHGMLEDLAPGGVRGDEQ